MNDLIEDKETGFLQNNYTSNYGFTVDKKIKFLELATAYRKQGKFPNVSMVCDMVGISIRTFERHLQLDTKFNEEWKEISTRIEYDCISDMSSLRQKNPMFMFGLLRYLNPQRWNPQANQGQQVNNITIFTENLKEIPKSIDTQSISESKP